MYFFLLCLNRTKTQGKGSVHRPPIVPGCGCEFLQSESLILIISIVIIARQKNMNWRAHTSRHRFVLSTALKKQDCKVNQDFHGSHRHSESVVQLSGLKQNIPPNSTHVVFVTQNKLENCSFNQDCRFQGKNRIEREFLGRKFRND